MSRALTPAVWIAAAPLVVCWGLWLAEVVAAAPRRPRPPAPDDAGLPTVDVLIPAHDEERSLPAVLDALTRDRTALGRIIVVADHCTDATARIAAEAGAVVVERDGGPAGKPAALRAGLERLAAFPDRGAGVLVLDADCVPSEGLVRVMAARLGAGDAVLQCAYLMERADGDAASAGVQVGVLLKNVVRPTGMLRLGLPCQLLGTGMLFRADVLDRVGFRDDLVEDLRMSHDLVRAGIHPRFVPEVRVVAALPPDRAALTQQRMRWEGGNLAAIRAGLGLGAARVLRGDARSAIALIDWSAPPLAVGVAAWTAVTTAAVALVAAGAAPPAALAPPALAAALLAAYLTVGVGTAAGPREIPRLARHVPRFLAWKAGVYARLAAGHGPATWARTPRDPQAGGEVQRP